MLVQDLDDVKIAYDFIGTADPKLVAAAKALASSLGVSWNVWTLEPSSATLHGRPVRVITSYSIHYTKLYDARDEKAGHTVGCVRLRAARDARVQFLV